MAEDKNTLILFRSVSVKLAEYFPGDAIPLANHYEELRFWLTGKLIDLLLNDMERLLQLLYRVDVNEQFVKNAFAQNKPEQIAPELARLIVEREQQKALSRIWYGGQDVN